MEKERFGYEWASSSSYRKLKDFARENRNHPTLSESILWGALRDELKSFRFRRQHIVGDFIVDFACLASRLAIEVDGGYHSEPQQENYDSLRSAYLESIGFRVIRFTNEDINNNLCDVIKQIKIELQQKQE